MKLDNSDIISHPALQSLHSCMSHQLFVEYVIKVGQIKVGHFFLRIVAMQKAKSATSGHSCLYTTLFGRVCNGCSHDFKFAETSSKFHKILYSTLLRAVYNGCEEQFVSLTVITLKHSHVKLSQTGTRLSQM